VQGVRRLHSHPRPTSDHKRIISDLSITFTYGLIEVT
jgi:hypothetical protein